MYLSLVLCLSFSLSLGGPDFEQVSRTFTYPAESDTACTTITVVDDRVALEGAEQFTVEPRELDTEGWHLQRES